MTTELASGKLIVDHPADHVARMRIVNPEKRGALDHEILDAIAAAVPKLEGRCLVITGVDRMFSAGYDIGGLPKEGFSAAAEKLVAHPFTEAITAIEQFPFPTIAALNGHAIGGGLELALACDLRLAAASAKLGMPPARLGLVYSHDGLNRFMQVIGPARTRELFYTAKTISADRAVEWGLVNEVLEDDQVEQGSLALARTIVANAPLSLRGNKRVIAALAHGAPLDSDTEAELAELRRACFLSDDFREGVEAFSQKREPRWRGH
jgi:enoyl-CoA hydratase/carnithine racemase